MEREEIRGSVARAKEAGAGRRAEDKSQICPESPLCGPETCRRGFPVARLARWQPRGLTAVDPYHGRARDRWRALLEVHAGPAPPIHTKPIMLNRSNCKPISYPVYCITG